MGLQTWLIDRPNSGAQCVGRNRAWPYRVEDHWIYLGAEKMYCPCSLFERSVAILVTLFLFYLMALLADGVEISTSIRRCEILPDPGGHICRACV